MNIFIRKSAVNQITKSDKNNHSFEALKAEVISILKKSEEKDIKKATDFFAIDENKYSYLEKSSNGGWIEKAGYGVGTVRVWKGKKYKKVSSAPVKWVRVYTKEDRGAKSSMTRLINKVNSCQTEEQLYNFCLQNHAIFQDENGVDLPIMDKLRNAISEKKNISQEIKNKEKEKKDAEKNAINENKIPEETKNNKSERKNGVTADGKEIDNQTNTTEHKGIAKAELTEDENGKQQFSIPVTKDIKKYLAQMLLANKQDIKDFEKGKYVNRTAMAGYGVNEGYLVVTDGRALNRVKIDGLEKANFSCAKLEEKDGKYIISEDDRVFERIEKVKQFNGKYEEKTVETTRKGASYPNASRVIPDNNTASISINNDVLIDKIKELKNKGYFDEVSTWNNVISKNKMPRLPIIIKNGAAYIGNTQISNKVTGYDDNCTIVVDYNYILNGLTQGTISDLCFNPEAMDKIGDENRYHKTVSISTSVSDYVFVPMRVEGDIEDPDEFEQSKRGKDLQNIVNKKAEKEAKNAEKRQDKENRTADTETKQKMAEDVPEGVTPENYQKYIDFGSKLYTKWGRDMNDPRQQADLKKQIKYITDQINNKDFGIVEALANKDNDFTRMIWTIQTGGVSAGNDAAETMKKVESYFGPEATEKYKASQEEKRKEAEIKRKEYETKLLSDKVDRAFDKKEYFSKKNYVSDEAKEVFKKYLADLPSNRQESAIKRMSKDLIRYQTGDGKEKVGYTLDYIKDLIDKGTTVEDIERTYRDIKSKPIVAFAKWYSSGKGAVEKSIIDESDFLKSIENEYLEETEISNTVSEVLGDLFD